MKSYLQFFVMFFCCLLISGLVMAQSSDIISGKVIDNQGLPVAGATVILDGDVGSVSDNDGMFTIKASGNKAVTLTITSTGYKPLTRVISVSEKMQLLTFSLEGIATGLDAVVVTATNVKRTNLETPISVSKLDDAELAKASYSSQADLLRGIPGITAEGGGGEVAANIFVRGLPSGGQYAFTPLELDGMPVIGTMGLNSSAPDVYFRVDAGIDNMEFVRGGASILHGIGSAAGIINYNSKVGTDEQKTTLKSEVGQYGRVKLDFNTGGPLNENGLYYNVTGTYRYDNGPMVSGIPSNGYQIRANIRKILDRGSFAIYGQYIDDRAQFYSPYHLTSDRKRPVGWDGETIYTMITSDVTQLTAKTPDGIYKSKSANGTYTKGGYMMADFVHLFSGGWKFNAKLRIANYNHEFNFFNTDGFNRNPLTQATFFDQVVKIPNATDIKYAYADDNVVLNSNTLLVENIIVDRIRPLNDASSNFSLTKTIRGNNAAHSLTFGSLLARTTAGDFNVQMRYLSEFKDQPRLVNLTYKDAGVSRSFTVNGVTTIPTYANINRSSNRTAFYLTDEIVMQRLNIDLGARVETQNGGSVIEKRTTAKNADGINVNWGNGAFDRSTVNATDWAASAAVGYKLKKGLNAYANFARGYFFPSIAGVSYVQGVPVYPKTKTERILQKEVGIKLLTSKFSASLALFDVVLKNRRKVLYEYVGAELTTTTKVTNSRSYGVELTYNWGIVKNLSFLGSATYQHHEYTKYEDVPTNVGDWLERQPRVMFNSQLEYNDSRFDVSTGINYKGKRFGNASNAVELDPYSIVRMDAGYTIKLAEKSSLRLGVGVFNLFDAQGVTEGNPRAGDTQTNTGDYFVGRPILPRAFFGRMALRF